MREPLSALPSLAYPVHNPHGLTLNTDYLTDLRRGLERANLYHHDDSWASALTEEDDDGPQHQPNDDGPQPAPCRNLSLTGGLNVGLRCFSGAIQFLGFDDRGHHPAWWGNNFSFVPPLWNDFPKRNRRSQPGAHHIGDVTLRLQPASKSNFSDVAFYSSSRGGDAVNVTTLSPSDALWPPSTNRIIEAVDLTPTLLAPGQVDTRYPLGGLHVVRSFEDPADAAGGLVMRFTLSVDANASEGVAVRGLGLSMVSDNTWGGLNTTQVAAGLSFMDPHIGRDQSWHTWSRADGSRTLVAMPYSDEHSHGAPMEAYRPVFEDAGWTQAGTYEWVIHSAGWADEWAVQRQTPLNSFQDPPGPWPNPKSPWPSWHLNETIFIPDKEHTRQWHQPTSLVLQPGESRAYAIRLALADAGPQSRDELLLAAGHVAYHAVPGYVLAPDMRAGGAPRLLLELPKGGHMRLVNATSSNPHAVEILSVGTVGSSAAEVTLTARAAGRARIELTFSDGTIGTAHYIVVGAKSLREHVSNYGRFAVETAWLPHDYPDPFARGSSIVPWDREDHRHVMQDGRTFVVGLSDDAGGAAHLGLAAKNAYAPSAREIAALEEYVNSTLFGEKPPDSCGGECASPHFSLQSLDSLRIRMTVFYYHYTPDYHTALQVNVSGHDEYYTELDKCYIGPSWCGFNAITNMSKPDWAPADYRQYNFPHTIAVYYSLYLAARNLDQMPTARPWAFYLRQAADTLLSLGCCQGPPGGSNLSTAYECHCVPTVGLMDGTVFREVLLALHAEAAYEAEQQHGVPADAPPEHASPPPPTPYEYRRGALTAGNDRPGSPLANVTLEEAMSTCTADDGCAGLTYHSGEPHPSEVLAKVYLKSMTSGNTDANWSTYVKPHPPKPPRPAHTWSFYHDVVRGMMHNRTVGPWAGKVPWNDQDAPYGSEFNWDTTGQEEVGVWGAFFNASSTDPLKGELQQRAVSSILAFMPSTPNFGYHGSAGGWGDFSNNGKWMVRGGWEREGGHYRAGLNAIPLAERYRSHPDELYLLETALGGITGVLANIDAHGAPSMAFHLYPFMLEYDPYSGDHGLGFFGHAMNVGAYVARSPKLGWLCYLCALSPPQPADGASYAIASVLDSFRKRAYVGPVGLWLVLQTGQLLSLTVHPANRTMDARIGPDADGGTWLASKVRVQLDAPAFATGRRTAHGFTVSGAKRVRDAFELDATGSEVRVQIKWAE